MTQNEKDTINRYIDTLLLYMDNELDRLNELPNEETLDKAFLTGQRVMHSKILADLFTAFREVTE